MSLVKNILILNLLLVFAGMGCKQETVVETQSIGATSSSPSTDEVYGKWLAGSLPITIRTSGDFSEAERATLEQVGEKWEQAVGGGMNLTNFSASAIANQDLGSMQSYLNGNIEVHQVNNAILSSGSLAVTVFSGVVMNAGTSSEYIRLHQADILFNYNDFSFSNNNTFGTIDIGSVMIHEMGHLLGLGHVDHAKGVSVMNPSLGFGQVKQVLRNRDQSNIRSNYGSGVLGLAANFSFAGGARSPASSHEDEKEGEVVSGYFELRADDTCHHFIDGDFVSSHSHSVNK